MLKLRNFSWDDNELIFNTGVSWFLKLIQRLDVKSIQPFAVLNCLGHLFTCYFILFDVFDESYTIVVYGLT